MIDVDRLRILLVEDDELVAKALSRLLVKEADVVHVDDIGSAVETLARENAYDLVLCDLRLGSAQGTELYAILKERNPDYLERVAFMSGLGDEPPELAAFRHVPCLGKPLHVATAIDLARKGRLKRGRSALSGS